MIGLASLLETKQVIDRTTAMIGAAATIIGALIPVLYGAIKDWKGKHLSGRRTALSGRWEGKGKDFYVEGSEVFLSFRLVMIFTSTGRNVNADAELSGTWNGGETTDKLVARGEFYNDDYLQLSYWNVNLTKKHLGVIVLGLLPDGETLRGSYTGFSPRRNSIIAGTVELCRKA